VAARPRGDYVIFSAGCGCGGAAFVFMIADAHWWALGAAILGLALIVLDFYLWLQYQANEDRLDMEAFNQEWSEYNEDEP
jgi:hypothetical protein